MFNNSRLKRPAIVYAWALGTAGVLAATDLRRHANWCPLQAYAVLVLLCAARVFWHIRNRDTHKRVRTCAGFCMKCKRTTVHRCGNGTDPVRPTQPVVSKKNDDLASAYDQIHYAPPRAHLVVLGAAAWIAYGALFHEGTHPRDFDLPLVGEHRRAAHLVRTLVYVVLAGAAFARRKQGSAVEWTLFFVLLAWPPHQSIVQQLGAWLALARLTLFAALLGSSDALDVEMHHREWCAALKKSRILRARTRASLAAPAGARAADDDCLCETSDSGILAAYSWLPRAAWVLVAGSNAITLIAAVAMVGYAWATIFSSRIFARQTRPKTYTPADVEMGHLKAVVSEQRSPSPKKRTPPPTALSVLAKYARTAPRGTKTANPKLINAMRTVPAKAYLRHGRRLAKKYADRN